MWGLACGAFAAWRWMPIQREMEASNAMLRKTWMRYPMVGGVFGFAYFCGMQLPVRFFQKATHRNEGISAETYKGKHDIVGRFRLFENSRQDSSEDKLLDFLAMYDKDPLSKPQLLDHLVKRISEQTDLTEVFRVKRQGKDANPIFWQFGKIHGLENIAFCDPDELKACNGNPYTLQKLVNKVSPLDAPGFSSYEELQEQLHKTLADYKAEVEKLSLYPSDKKKLLALPFALAKRQENPEPKEGQAAYDLFTELTGKDWNSDLRVKFDQETKITEFDYENYLNPALLEGVDTQTEEFKNFVRALNFMSKTKYEKHQDNKKKFSSIMSVLAGLNAEDQRALLHLV